MTTLKLKQIIETLRPAESSVEIALYSKEMELEVITLESMAEVEESIYYAKEEGSTHSEEYLKYAERTVLSIKAGTVAYEPTIVIELA